MVLLIKLLAAFRMAKEADGRAKRTLADYDRCVGRFVEWCGAEGLALATLDRDDVRRYVVTLRRSGLANATVAIHIRNVRTFLNWLHREGHTTVNLAKAVSAPKTQLRYEDPLSADEIAMLFKACDGDQAVRDRAIVLTWIDTGLRLGEMERLNLSDLHVEDNGTAWLRVDAGKSDRDRVVILGETTTAAVLSYLEQREDDLPALWVGKRWSSYKRLAYRGLSSLVKRIAEAANLEDRVHPHLFRKTFATHFLDNGGDPERLRVLAGWSSFAMLEVYINSARRRLMDAHRRAGPVDNLDWRMETA